MKTIILPGYSPHNHEWAEDIAAELPEAVVHVWGHWRPGGSFDGAAETAAVLGEIDPGGANLLAKSVGCRVAAAVVGRAPGRVGKLLLCGIPGLGADLRADLAEALAALPAERVLVVQNRADPYAPCEQVRAMIREIAPQVVVLEREREDHHYPYPGDFRAFLIPEG